jgi:signal transduction histidine kinase
MHQHLRHREHRSSTATALPMEQLIAIARLLFAAFAYVAIYVDPTQPARYSTVTYGILSAYLIYAVLVTALSWTQLVSRTVQLVTHVIDIVAFSVLMSFTDGPTSPFFVFFTFALVTATLRWDWPAALSTTICLVTMLLVVSYADKVVFGDGQYELNRLIIRATYLVVCGALLCYLSSVRQRNRERIEKLASWPQEPAAGENPPIARTLQHAAKVLDAPRILVVWEDHEEPDLFVAHWTGEACAFTQWRDARVLASLEACADHSALIARPRAATIVHTASRAGDLPCPLPTDFTDAFVITTFAAVGIPGERIRSWMLILDHPAIDDELLSLIEIAAARVAAELTASALRSDLTRAAIARERVRLARDMHDGILQNLTAVTLQLKALTAALPKASAGRIKELTDLLAAQQQQIRAFVHEANPKTELAGVQPLAPQIRAFAARVNQQWNCSVETEILPADLTVAPGLIGEIWLMISEATANAVRHGGATRLAVTVERQAGALNVRFWNNGTGHGGTEGETRSSLPFSLHGRVRDLGGSLERAESTSGFAVDIRLPVA